jgi:hypothetical protein
MNRLGEAPTMGFFSTVEYWNGVLADTNEALTWLYAEFYNEWGEWMRRGYGQSE